MKPPKAKHKHFYAKYLRQTRKDPPRYSLVNICVICNREKEVPFKENLCKRSDGTWKWMTSVEDFEQIYGPLPRIDLLHDDFDV